MSQLVAPSIDDRFLWNPIQPAECVASVPKTPIHYKIGAVSVRVKSDLTGVEQEFHRLFKQYVVSTPLPDEFRIDVITKRSPRTLRRYHHIYADGEDMFAVRRQNAVLPHIEWAINCMVARYLPRFLQVHAAAMSRDGMGVIFPGSPGRGKSTLAAGLLAAGWSYLSDEFALIDPQSKTLMPYPKALCIKAGSFETLDAMGLPLELDRIYDKGEKGPVAPLNPLAVRADAIADPCPIGLVIFPEYGAGAPPRIEPMSAAHAAFELSRVSFNLIKYRRAGVAILVDVARRARCYRLITGDLQKTCRLVDRCLTDHLESEPSCG